MTTQNMTQNIQDLTSLDMKMCRPGAASDFEALKPRCIEFNENYTEFYQFMNFNAYYAHPAYPKCSDVAKFYIQMWQTFEYMKGRRETVTYSGANILHKYKSYNRGLTYQGYQEDEEKAKKIDEIELTEEQKKEVSDSEEEDNTETEEQKKEVSDSEEEDNTEPELTEEQKKEVSDSEEEDNTEPESVVAPSTDDVGTPPGFLKEILKIQSIYRYYLVKKEQKERVLIMLKMLKNTEQKQTNATTVSENQNMMFSNNDFDDDINIPLDQPLTSEQEAVVDAVWPKPDEESKVDESKVDEEEAKVDEEESKVESDITDDRYTMDIGKTGKKSGIKIKKRNKKTLEELLEICINEGCKYVSWNTKKNQGWVYKEDAELKNFKKNKDKYKFYTLI